MVPRYADAVNGSQEVGGFRVLLAAGAIVSVLLGVWGLFLSGALHIALGPAVEESNRGFVGMARLLGAGMLAIGVGYALAAVHPLRNRGLLVVLFLAPLLAGIALVIAAAKDEIAPARGAVFAVVDLAYCLLYFRLYPKPLSEMVPRPDERPEPTDEPPDQPIK